MNRIRISSTVFLFLILLGYIGAMLYSARGNLYDWKACFLDDAIRGNCGK